MHCLLLTHTMLFFKLRCTQEIRQIWVGYWSQADATLGQKLDAKLKSAPIM